MHPAIWIALGLVALVAGAELVVRYGSLLARQLGVPPIIVGLTIVSIGTSAPELAVGIDAMVHDAGSLALGNIAGTNTLNLLLILGLSAMLRPLALGPQTLRLDLVAMVASSLIVVALSLDQELSTGDGVALIMLAVVYTLFLVHFVRRERAVAELVPETTQPATDVGGRRVVIGQAALLLAGMAVIVIGAEWLVGGAVSLGESLGVPEALIGLTIVAIGTSAPELATTIISTLRGDRDIAVGNLIGSSIYNLTFVLGTALLFGPPAVEVDRQLLAVDLPIMALAALACIPIFVSGARIRRREGTLFVTAYAFYLTSLIVVRA